MESFLVFKTIFFNGTGEMAQWLSAVAALPEDEQRPKKELHLPPN